MVSPSDLNPLADINFSGMAFGKILGLFILGCIIAGLVAFLIIWFILKRQYRYKIPLYKARDGEINFKIGDYVAKDFILSKRGEKLWFVKGIKKFLPPATLTDAPNSFPHEEREDGEWINFQITSVNAEQKKAGVKFIAQDMRHNSVAIGDLLESRLIKKTFWEKWGVVIGYVIFFLVITVAVTINLYMMSKTLEQFQPILSTLKDILEEFKALKDLNGSNSLIPAFIGILMFKQKNALKTAKNSKIGEI